MTRRVLPVVTVGLLVVAFASAGCTSSAKTHEAGSPGVRIVYQVSDNTTTPATIQTMESESSSPYVGRILTYNGDSTNAQPLSGIIWTRESLYNINTDGAAQETQKVPPAPAPPATHLDVALPVALAQGIVKKLGLKSVMGHACTQWVSKEPLDSAPIAKADKANFTISCVSKEGFLLSDSWTLSGTLARDRTATELMGITHYGEAQALEGRAVIPAPTGVADEVVANIALNKASLGVTAVAPPGYAFDRSVTVTRSIAGGTGPVVVRIGEVDAFTNGQNLIVLRRTKDLVGSAQPAEAGARVELGSLGSGFLAATGTGVSVTVAVRSGVLVTATSTADPQALVAWLKTLAAS